MSESFKINGHTKVYGILGRPVTHVLSPALHNAAFRELGINAIYVAFPVADISQAVAGLRGLGIAGVSVTIPFKVEVIPLLDASDRQASRIGAVNTIINDQGRLVGHNTDWQGAVAALKTKTAIAGEHFLILGAGGAARAITFGILEEGGRVTVADRDPFRARALALEWGVEAIPLREVEGCPAPILVNATPVGMTPDVEGLVIAPDLLSRFKLVMDAVYRPLATRLLKEAQARGCATVNGLQMLVNQATMQFRLFTGREVPVEVMTRAAHAALGEGGIEEIGGEG
jgi:shikimate dehydrogenase